MKKAALMSTALLTMATSTAALAGNEQCFAEKTARSAESTTATTITFDSEAPVVVQLFELDAKGQRVLKGELEPGKSASHETFATHPWVIASLDGDCRGVFFAQDQPRTVPAH